MTEPNFSAIRARLRYQSVDDFIEGYARYITAGGMFIPMAPAKLKPVGTTVRFQFILGDGVTALLGEGIVRQIRGLESQNEDSPVGMLVRFTKLSQDSKVIVDRIMALKAIEDVGISLGLDSEPEEEPPAPVASAAPQDSGLEEATGELDDAAVEEVLRMAEGDQAPQERATSHDDNTAERRLDEAEASLLAESAGDSNDEEEPHDHMLSLFDGLGGSDEEPQTRDVSEAVDEQASDEHASDATPMPGQIQAETFRYPESEVEEEPVNLFADATPVPESMTPTRDVSEAESVEAESVEAEAVEAAAVEAEADDHVLSFWDDDDMFGESGEESAASEPEPEAVVEPEPEPEPEAVVEPEPALEEQVSTPIEGPKALRETEAGLKVIAFEEGPHDDEAAREFENFAFGGDEDDVDEMFDNIFGGGDGDDFFGGGGDGDDFFGGGEDEPAGFEEPSAEPEPVVEAEPEPVVEAEPELEDFFAAEEAVEDVAEESAEEPQAAAEESFVLSDIVEEPVADPEQSEPFELNDPADEIAEDGDGSSSIVAGLTLDSVVELDDDEFFLEEGSEALDAASFAIEGDEPEDPEDDGEDEPMLGLQEELSEPLELGGFALDEAPEEEQVEEPAQGAGAEEEEEEEEEEEQTSDELLSLLGSMEESDAEEEEEELSLSFGLSASAPPAPPEEDEEPDSFSALLASAQKELESKQGPEEEKPKDILDELLGDDDLPPPVTSAVSPFAMPDTSKKEKKGFMSKLFGKD